MREERGRAGKLLEKEVRRAEVMAMGVEKKANCQSELPMLRLNQTYFTNIWTWLCRQTLGRESIHRRNLPATRWIQLKFTINLEQLHSIKFLS